MLARDRYRCYRYRYVVEVRCERTYECENATHAYAGPGDSAGVTLSSVDRLVARLPDVEAEC